jgi:hypothetical protein
MVEAVEIEPRIHLAPHGPQGIQSPKAALRFLPRVFKSPWPDAFA